MQEKMQVVLPDSAKKAKFRMDTVKKMAADRANKQEKENIPIRSISTPEFSRGRKLSGMEDSSRITDDSQSLTSTVHAAASELAPGLDIQPHLTAALAVVESAGLHRSPSLRRISVMSSEPPATTAVEKSPSHFNWRRKKTSEPPQKLVFSFSHDDDDDDLTEEEKRIKLLEELKRMKDEKDGMRYEEPQQEQQQQSPPVPCMVVSTVSPVNDDYCPLDYADFHTNGLKRGGGMGLDHGLGIEEDKEEVTTHVDSLPSSGYKSLQVSASLDQDDTVSIASFRSQRTSHTLISAQQPQEKQEAKREKRQRFWDNLTMVGSIVYGLCILSLGILVYLYDILVKQENAVEATPTLNLFLSCVGLMWLIYLIVDIKRFVHAMEKRAFGTIDLGDMQLVEGEDGQLHIELTLPNQKKKMLPEYYGFTSGRHSGSFFLKIGAGFFCVGHLIHMGCNIAKELVFLYHENLKDYCSNMEAAAVDFIIPFFSLLQFYVIFKFGNVIVNKNKPLARFAFMHCISSCLCFWMNTITNETVDSLVDKMRLEKTDPCAVKDGDGGDSGEVDDYYHGWSRDDNDEYGLIPNCSGLDTFSCHLEKRHYCVSENSISEGLFGIASFLYPFSIEFNILVVGVWYIMWSNIGNIHDHKDSLLFLPSVTPRGSQEALHKTQGHHEALIVFADCKSSINGLFLGVIVFVATFIGVIIIYILDGSCDKEVLATSVNISNVLESSILCIMILVSVVTYYKIAGLEVNPDPISFLDDMLLLICVPMFIVYFILCIGPTILSDFEPYYLVTNSLTIIQVFIQTPLIVDGLRRCTISEENQRKLKGRNSLMLLIVLNLATYLLEAMLIKSKNNQKVKIGFYGKVGWTVLSHVTLPLCIFYRFHSAAALVDIWNAAYKPPEHH